MKNPKTNILPKIPTAGTDEKRRGEKRIISDSPARHQNSKREEMKGNSAVQYPRMDTMPEKGYGVVDPRREISRPTTTHPMRTEGMSYNRQPQKAEVSFQLPPQMQLKYQTRTQPDDNELLHEESLKMKQNINAFIEENTKLRTKILYNEKELDKKEKTLQELVEQVNGQRSHIPAMTQKQTLLCADQHTVMGLKKQVRELKQQAQQQEQEVAQLRANLKAAKLQDMEIKIKLHAEECYQLKMKIFELMQEPATEFSPKDLAFLEEKLQQQNYMLNEFKQESARLSATIEKTDTDAIGYKEQTLRLEKKAAKLDSESKTLEKNKKIANDNAKEIQKLKEQIAIYKVDNNQDPSTYKSRVEDLQRKQVELNNNLTKKDETIKQMEQKITIAQSDKKLSNDLQEKEKAQLKEKLKQYESCLLYTSPSPRDLSTSRMPSSA
eukprot:TRINITY_DN10468_c0_g1_i2.p1 TRINITY_DN10468_c0_g1~~TRINITY_DN10468_c0_g1_i2.p1  ORF type:complete len:438 (+),score=105.49 TRINITY_DN10468_c0_g1_i2:38-1351(+)